MRKIKRTLITGLLLTGLTLSFNACTEQAPFEPGDRKDLSAALNKNPNRTADSLLLTEADNTVNTTKEQGSMTSRYSKKWDAYQGGKINLSQGSQFGPHGSTFEPTATVWFHYPGSNPKLYYVEDDATYTEQKPDEVDLVNGWVNFSRYAVAWSN